MLLHALAILLFGAPSGGSREGRAMWGSLQVVIRNVMPQPPPEAVALPAPPPEPAPVLETPRAPQPQVAPPAAEAPAEAPEAAKPFPQLLDRLPNDIKLETLPPLVVPPPMEAPPARPAPPIPKPMLEPLQPMPETKALPGLERVPEIRIPAEAPRIPAPLLQPMPQMPERSTLPPIERVPTIEAPALPAQSERPPIKAEPLRSVTPPAPEVAKPPVPEVAKPPVPEVAKPPVPEVAKPPVPEVAKPPVPEVAKPSAPEVARPAPPESVRTPAPEAPRTLAPQPARPAEIAPPKRESPVRAPEGSSDYDPTKPGLDPDALRRRASELARQGTGQRAPLAFPLPAIDKPRSKLEKAIEDARKPDCREAYKSLGLAAVVPLIANEFGDGTCRW